MSVKTKKRFRNIGKVVASALFVILLFTNIKVALMDESDTAGIISSLGIKVELFIPTLAEQLQSGHYEASRYTRDYGSLGTAYWFDCIQGEYDCTHGGWGFI